MSIRLILFFPLYQVVVKCRNLTRIKCTKSVVVFCNTHSYIGLRKVLQLWTINHRNYFVKLAEMPENNRFQKVLIKNLCGPMSSESWQKSTK